jgi:predicted lipoprotein with Yx(FWY)xxD motif
MEAESRFNRLTGGGPGNPSGPDGRRSEGNMYRADELEVSAMRQGLMSRSRSLKLPTAGRRWATIVCAGALVFGAYGLLSAPAFASSKTSSSPKVAVKTKKLKGLGTVLVDAKGRTLYTLTNAGQPVACTGGCTSVWPPLLLPAGSTPKGAKGVTGLSLVGGQVAASGLPLYRFSGDSKAGQANGEGISSFGGVWHVVKVGGSASSTGSSKPSSGGGYGY